MRVQLGALFAAGHAPRDVMDWTWGEIREAMTCVQAYHAHLGSTLVSGKSKVVDDAKRSRRERLIAERALAEAFAAGRGQEDAAAAAALARDDAALAQLAAAGFKVTVNRGHVPDIREWVEKPPPS